MPYHYTFPTLFDNALQINISKLKEWGFLNLNQIMYETLWWGTNGERTASISVMGNTVSEDPFFEFKYTSKGKPRKYLVALDPMRSNLGKGTIWYFLCPATNKRCRKLYLINGYFLHREAFKGAMYESQTYSKTYRSLHKALGAYFKLDSLCSQLYNKHFKKSYLGKPTKRFLKLSGQIQTLERISIEEIEQLILN